MILTKWFSLSSKVKKSKAIPVKGREGPQGCETSKLPYFLDNRFSDGVEVASLKPVALYPQEYSWYSFLLQAESTSES
jgi:hypothetical protein